MYILTQFQIIMASNLKDKKATASYQQLFSKWERVWIKWVFLEGVAEAWRWRVESGVRRMFVGSTLKQTWALKEDQGGWCTDQLENRRHWGWGLARVWNTQVLLTVVSGLDFIAVMRSYGRISRGGKYDLNSISTGHADCCGYRFWGVRSVVWDTS